MIARTAVRLAVLVASVMASTPARAQSPDDLIAQGQNLLAHGDYRQALDVLEPLAPSKALTPLQSAHLHQLLAAARSQTGPDDQALAESDRAEREATPIGAYDILARIESVRGVVWLNRGRSFESLRHFRLCLDWAEKARVPALVAGAYIRLAAAYQDLGDWTRALDAVDHSFEADPNPSDPSRVQYLTRRGLVLVELHEGEAAKDSIGRALDLVRSSGDRRTECQVLIDMALVHERVDHDPKHAAEYAADAAAIARELRLPSLEIPALNELGSLQRLAGQFDKAFVTLTAARARIATANEHRDDPYVLKNLGQVLVGLGRAAEGARTLQQAADRADATGLTRVRWLARLELADLHASSDPAAARREFDETLAIVEEQQASVLLEGFRAGALDQTLSERDPYDRDVQFLLDHGDSPAAFFAAERERARVFLDTLSGARDAWASTVPAGFSEKEGALLQSISSKQAALRTDLPSDERRRDTLAAIDRDETDLTALRLRLAVERPALAQARYPKLWTVGDLQRQVLSADESLVGFFLGAERSVAWVMTRERMETVLLPPRAVIEQRVREALQELRDPVSRDDAAVKRLSKTLEIDRLMSGANGARLLVIPHGILCDVPLEALMLADGRRIVERFAVSYAPSASSLAFFRALPAQAPPALTLLAAGNPVVNSTASARERQADLEHVNLLAPVPHSAEELRGIAALFGKRVTVLEGTHATKSELREANLDQAAILHFATHGLIDEIRPERSGLVLTANPPVDDGLLQMREIYAMHLHAELVTLSACQTALGQHVTGEGIIGLTRAFFYAGARTVVASLWDIEDASTARLMQQFYLNVRNGEPIDFALQHAKIAFMRGGGETSRPFYWASFVVNGQARLTVARQADPVNRTMIAGIAGAAIGGMLLCGLLLAAYRKRTSL